jgi:thioredoxin reductase (NADPH)
MFFSRYASKVTMLVRGSSLQKGMSQYLVDQINATKNIEVQMRASVTEVIGTNRLEALVIKDNDTGDIETVPAAALFVFIGAKPHSGFVADVVERNEAGFILTGPDLIRTGRRPKNWRLNRDPFLLETSVPGIFAVGDVRQGAIRRVASAVGQGSTAVSFVHQYLKTV